MTPTKQDDALAALDCLRIYRHHLPEEHKKLFCEHIETAKQALTSGAGGDVAGVDLDELKRETVRAYDIHIQNNERCFLSPVEWAIDHLASTGRIRGEWRPISEAPRGKWVLVADGHGVGAWQACWSGKHKYWVTMDDHMVSEPTHFMPLPAAPGERG